jgi:hypothetical protein
MSHRTRKPSISRMEPPVAGQVVEPAQSIADRIEASDHALTVQELSALYSTSPSWWYQRARSGRMGRAVIRIGGTVRFDPVLTGQWLRSLSTD